MSSDIYRSYYQDDVLNATPQRLRLMLIEGAIRFANAAVEQWETDNSAAFTALGRCRNIIIELIAGVRADRESCEHVVDHILRDQTLTAEQRKAEIEQLETIGRNTMSIYLIIFRHLNEAQLDWDSAKITAAIGVLEIERETARMICEQLPAAPILTAPKDAEEISSSDAAAMLGEQDRLHSQETPQPHITAPPTYGGTSMPAASSMSFDA